MHSRKTKQIKVLFFTKYVCRSSVDFAGPVGERYAGLYFSFMERFGKDYRFFWHSGVDGRTYKYHEESNTLQPLLLRGNSCRSALINVLLYFCLHDFTSRKVFVVSYPYFPASILLAILLFVLKPFRFRVIVDVQDLTRETPGTVGYLLWRMVDELYFLHAFFIVNAAECAKLYARRARDRTIIIPMAAHHNVITPKLRPAERNGLVLGYVGTITKTRGFPDLIDIVKNLRAEGLAIELVITGSNAEKIDFATCPWIHFHDVQPLNRFSELLQSMDVGVIPYVDREYWGRMSITKMATYMAAGLPIVSLQLTETANILAKWNCGISVEDWEGMTAAIKSLYQNESLMENLGKNARRAAIEEYNWAKQVQKLGEFIRDVTN